MSGYPPPNYGYGPPPPSNQPHAPTGASPYANPPPPQPYGHSPYAHSGDHKPQEGYKPQSGDQKPQEGYKPQSGDQKPQEGYKPQSGAPYQSSSSGYPQEPSGGYPQASSGYPPSVPAYGNNPFGALVPSVFPPGTDPNVVACFQTADQDGSGFIDDKELQRALSSYNQSFSIRTVHLLMYLFTNSNTRKIGPKEFTQVFYSLQNWRGIFERFDRDRSGKIDTTELKEALFSLGFAVSPVVLDLLVSKFDKSGGRNKAIEYDNFIECCLTVKGLTEKFKEKDTTYSGSATFNYEAFMLTVLPFLIA